MEKIRLNHPTLVLWAGVAAVGKTTLLDQVIENVEDAFIIEKDVIADSFLTTHHDSEKEGVSLYKLSGPLIHRPSSHYNAHIKFQHYRCMLALARHNLERGKHPIIDGNFSNLIPMRYLEEVIDPFFAETEHTRKIVYCHAPEEVIKKRMEKRGESRDKQFYETQEAWERYIKERPIVPKELEHYDHLKVDTSETPCLNARRVLDYLQS